MPRISRDGFPALHRRWCNSSPRSVRSASASPCSAPGCRRRCRTCAGGSLRAAGNGPRRGRNRVWHARRNVEMLAGIFLRDVLRMPVRLALHLGGAAPPQALHALDDRPHGPRRRDEPAIGLLSQGAARRSSCTGSIPGRSLKPWRSAPASGCSATWSAAPGASVTRRGRISSFEAMIDLLPDYPAWTAVVTGRVTAEHRDFLDDLRRRIRAAGLEDRIRFTGEVDDIRPWYRRMTLFVAPSRNEGFGLTPLEAMASGTAAVTSDAGAYAEMILPGETGRSRARRRRRCAAGGHPHLSRRSRARRQPRPCSRRPRAQVLCTGS